MVAMIHFTSPIVYKMHVYISHIGDKFLGGWGGSHTNRSGDTYRTSKGSKSQVLVLLRVFICPQHGTFKGVLVN